jgi:polar amino acid transport system permease protein
MLDTAFTRKDLGFLMQGAAVTLAVTLIAVAFGTALGLVFGILEAQFLWLALAPLTFVLDVLRSVPLLIQLILADAFQSILKLGLSPFLVACVVLSLHTAAYCTEIVMGGIDAVPAVTRRAARSLGMSWRQDMANITLPMAARVALPGWIGLAPGAMKDSALILWLGSIELLRASQIRVTRLQEPLFILMVAGAIYFLLSFPIARLGARLEQRWRAND